MEEQSTYNEWDYKSDLDTNAAETQQCAMTQRGYTTRTAIVGIFLSVTACALLLIDVFGELHGKCIDRSGNWKGSWCELQKPVVQRVESTDCFVSTGNVWVSCEKR